MTRGENTKGAISRFLFLEMSRENGSTGRKGTTTRKEKACLWVGHYTNAMVTALRIERDLPISSLSVTYWKVFLAL